MLLQHQASSVAFGFIIFELVFFAVLVLVEPVVEVFAMAPFPLTWLGWMLLAPWVVLLVDDRFTARLKPRVAR